MDKNHVLTNALFRKKLAELTGEDIAQTPHFNDFQALDGSTFKTEMDKLIANPPWSDTPSPTPVDSDSVVVKFTMTDEEEDIFIFEADKEYTDIRDAALEGKAIECLVCIGEDGEIAMRGFPIELKQSGGSFVTYGTVLGDSDYQITFINIEWNPNASEEPPITGTMTMLPLSGGGGTEEVLLTADLLITQGGMSLGNVRDADGNEPTYSNLIQNIISSEKKPMRMILHGTSIVEGLTVNTYFNLSLGQYDVTTETITFEGGMIDTTHSTPRVIFSRVMCVYNNGSTEWAFDQQYLSN